MPITAVHMIYFWEAVLRCEQR